jgi:hypothetical protein
MGSYQRYEILLHLQIGHSDSSNGERFVHSNVPLNTLHIVQLGDSVRN